MSLCTVDVAIIGQARLNEYYESFSCCIHHVGQLRKSGEVQLLRV